MPRRRGRPALEGNEEWVAGVSRPTSGPRGSSATQPGGSTTGSSPSAATAADPPCRGSRSRAQARPAAAGERGTSSSSGRPAPARSISGTSAPRSAEYPRPQAAGRDASALERWQCVALILQRSECLCAGLLEEFSAAGAAPRRRWCSTTPPRRAGWYAARSRNRGCSRSSEPTTASRAGTATPIRETRRAPSRTPWGSSGATSSSPCLRSARSPSSTRSSPRGARGSTRRRAAATAGRTGRPTGRTSPPCAPFPAWSSTR